MKIGIIVHSRTGNTLQVAEKFYTQYLKAGHTVVLEKVTAVNDAETSLSKVALTNAPKIDEYDVLVFGAPVNGFRLSLVMQAYLNQLYSLEGKIIFGFVSQYFPFPSLGGKQAIKCLTKMCLVKGAEIAKTGIINWKNEAKRNILIAETIDKFKI